MLHLNPDIAQFLEKRQVQEIIAHFAELLTTESQALRQAYDEKKFLLFLYHAQRLRGAALYFTLPELHAKLEEAIKLGEQETITAWQLQELLQYITTLQTADIY